MDKERLIPIGVILAGFTGEMRDLSRSESVSYSSLWTNDTVNSLSYLPDGTSKLWTQWLIKLLQVCRHLESYRSWQKLTSQKQCWVLMVTVVKLQWGTKFSSHCPLLGEQQRKVLRERQRDKERERWRERQGERDRWRERQMKREGGRKEGEGRKEEIPVIALNSMVKQRIITQESHFQMDLCPPHSFLSRSTNSAIGQPEENCSSS